MQTHTPRIFTKAITMHSHAMASFALRHKFLWTCFSVSGLLDFSVCWGEILDSMMHAGDRRGLCGPFFSQGSTCFEKFFVHFRICEIYSNSKYEICKSSYLCWKFVAVTMQLDKMNEMLLETPKGENEVIDCIRDMLWQFKSSFFD